MAIRPNGRWRDEDDMGDVILAANEDGTSGWQQLLTGRSRSILEVTLTLDTNAYATGDVLAATQEISSAVRYDGGTGLIEAVTLLDKDDNGTALDLVFLQTNVSIGTENAAVSISDANAEEILGVVEVAAGDYVDLVNNQVAPKTGLNIPVAAASDSTSLFIAAVSRATSTYTASGIVVKVHIQQD